MHFKDIQLRAGERIQVEQSLKYSSEETQHLWKMSGLDSIKKWSASSEAYSKYRCIKYFCTLFSCKSSEQSYRGLYKRVRLSSSTCGAADRMTIWTWYPHTWQSYVWRMVHIYSCSFSVVAYHKLRLVDARLSFWCSVFTPCLT